MSELSPRLGIPLPVGTDNNNRLNYRAALEQIDAAAAAKADLDDHLASNPAGHTAGSITDTLIGNRTADQVQTPSGSTGTLTQLISWLANRIKAITGKTNWYDAPDTTLAAAKSHMDAAAPRSGHATTAALSTHQTAATLDHPDGPVMDANLGNRTSDPAQAPSGNPGTLTQMLSWLANRIKAITGGTNWYDAPAYTLAKIKGILDGTDAVKVPNAALASGAVTLSKLGSDVAINFVFNLVQRLGTETAVNAIVNLGGGILLAGTSTGGKVYRSTDYGGSWTLVQQLGTETQVLSFVNIGGGVVLAGTSNTGQVYRSTDYGASWSLVQRLGSETYVLALASLGNGVALAGTIPNGQVYRSTDNGASWSVVQRLGTEADVFAFANLGGGLVLVGTYPDGQIYRSADNGVSWSLVQRLGAEANVLCFANLGGGVVLASTGTNGQIYRGQAVLAPVLS